MYENRYSMPGYFQNLPTAGKACGAVKSDNESALKKVEAKIREAVKAVHGAGRSDESLNEAGQMTAMQRVNALVDSGTFCPLNSLYNPQNNDSGSTSIIKGLGRIDGKWAMVIAFDNKKLAGAWVPGQADNLIRAGDVAKRLRIPLVYLLNCSGVKLDEQEKVFPNRRGGGRNFYMNAELQQMGIPVIVGIYGTNPAGGGYHSVSPTILIAHEKANMAIGGAGIVSGINMKDHIDMESARQIIEDAKNAPKDPPGSVAMHYHETGFFREVCVEEEGVLETIKKYVSWLPSYNPEFFRVDTPREPQLPAEDLYSILPADQKQPYDIYDVLGRIFDNSEFMEYKKGYGREVVTGLAKMDGLPVGVIANVQGALERYPDYAGDGAGAGGRLYRQGLIKMSEFVTLCARDRVPVIWFQDTTGLDVGNDAERAEILGLGMTLMYSTENSDLPQLEITLRKGAVAGHYVMGGPQGGNTNAFSLGTAATEIYVMSPQTAATALYSRKLIKEQKAGNDLQPTIDEMNALIEDYASKSRPKYCAENGFVDEVVELTKLREYIRAFTGAAWQNPKSFCAVHHMLLPRAIREYDDAQK